MLFWSLLCHFCCPVVTLVTFSSNLITLKGIQKVNKKNPFFIPKNPENPLKKMKSPKIVKHCQIAKKKFKKTPNLHNKPNKLKNLTEKKILFFKKKKILEKNSILLVYQY